MLILKVLFYRNNKAPVTLDSKRVQVGDRMTISDFELLAQDFMDEFLKEYDITTHHIGARYILQG